jgi:DNA-directed RNA polymerase subunit beta'
MYKEGQEIKKGEKICEWDPFNAVIISEFGGIAKFDSIEEGVTFRLERDDQTGLCREGYR